MIDTQTCYGLGSASDCRNNKGYPTSYGYGADGEDYEEDEGSDSAYDFGIETSQF
jgi:hypothetical protein